WCCVSVCTAHSRAGRHVECLDGPSCADVRCGIVDRGDLPQLVGDDDGCHALVAQAADQPQQVLGVVVVQRGGGLVQDQQAHVLRQRLGDLDQDRKSVV